MPNKIVCPAVDLQRVIDHLRNLPLEYRQPEKLIPNEDLVWALKKKSAENAKKIHGRDRALLGSLSRYRLGKPAHTGHYRLTKTGRDIAASSSNNPLDHATVKAILKDIPGFIIIAKLYRDGNALTVKNQMEKMYGITSEKAAQMRECYRNSVAVAGLNPATAYGHLHGLIRDSEATTLAPEPELIQVDNAPAETQQPKAVSINFNDGSAPMQIDAKLLHQMATAAINEHQRSIEKLKVLIARCSPDQPR